MFRYRIYPLQTLANPAEQYHSSLRQEQVFAPLQVFGNQEEILPPLDLQEDSSAFYVTLETPGVKRENLTLSLQENVLTLKGKKAPPQLNDDETPRRRERGYGDFSRDILLPNPVQEGKWHFDGDFTKNGKFESSSNSDCQCEKCGRRIIHFPSF